MRQVSPPPSEHGKSGVMGLGESIKSFHRLNVLSVVVAVMVVMVVVVVVMVVILPITKITTNMCIQVVPVFIFYTPDAYNLVVMTLVVTWW